MKFYQLKIPVYGKVPKKEVLVKACSINDPLIMNCLKGNNFLPKSIESIIQNMYSNPNSVFCQSYHHKPTNCNLYYVSDVTGKDVSKGKHQSSRKAEQFLTLMVKMKCMWRGNDPANPINLVFWDVDEPKVFPHKGKVLGVGDVNSAVTYLYNGVKYGDIYIYRSEEASKIVVHEMIHALGIDRPLFESKMPVCVTSEMNTNEAFTEALALFCCHILSPNFNDSLKHMGEEYYHGLNQSAKILNHYGFTLDELIYKNGNKKAKAVVTNNEIKKCFPQTSGVFSYYIAKTSLLPHMDLVFECIGGRKNQYVINSKKAEKLLNVSLRNKQFMDDLNKKQRLESNRNMKGKTLRMSLFRK